VIERGKQAGRRAGQKRGRKEGRDERRTVYLDDLLSLCYFDDSLSLCCLQVSRQWKRKGGRKGDKLSKAGYLDDSLNS